jgi:uncharacterized protein (DUF1330 family)
LPQFREFAAALVPAAGSQSESQTTSGLTKGNSMKYRIEPIYALALGIVPGAAVGAALVQGLHAQSGPPAYYIAEVTEITNPDDFGSVASEVPATIQKYGGQYLVRGGRGDAVEGDGPKRIIVIAWKSMADAHKWYNSPEYSAIRPIRLRSSKARSFIVEGVPN